MMVGFGKEGEVRGVQKAGKQKQVNKSQVRRRKERSKSASKLHKPRIKRNSNGLLTGSNMYMKK
jgi:hypothetical protein